MKVSRTSNWFLFLFSRNYRYNFPSMLASVLTIGAITAVMVYLHEEHDMIKIGLPDPLKTVLGLVVGLLLVFRTNTAYDRWWEGRKQLGALINTCRNVAIKFHAYLEGANYEGKEDIDDLIAAFPWSMREHLREHNYEPEVEQRVPEKHRAAFLAVDHKPNYILLQLARHATRLNKERIITGEQLIVLEKELNLLINILGACERIRYTPMPMGYAIHLKRILLLYTITLPLGGMMEKLAWWTVPVVMLIFFTMVGIELLGEEIEEPFGEDPNDLPFNSIDVKIYNNVYEIVERPVPHQLEA